MLRPSFVACLLSCTLACGASGASPDSSTTIDAGDPADVSAASDAAPPAPARLSETGLYSDVASKTLAPGVQAFEPRFALWADGAEKSRFVWLPPGTQIDTSDMDHWSFPVGARFWKEFRVGSARVETRLLYKWGPGRDDVLFAAYQWNAQETDADLAPVTGVPNASGTTHDIPAVQACTACHTTLRERVIGFGAVQLSHDLPGVNMKSLVAQGLLTIPHDDFVIPGDATTQAALGYLHANCGNCHNTDDGVGFITPYGLRISTHDRTVWDTQAFRTSVLVPLDAFRHDGIDVRIAPGQPALSGVVYRMTRRGVPDQMPPSSTKQIDDAGIAAVSSWIAAMPRALESGHPASP
jgi:hypothetical protein